MPNLIALVADTSVPKSRNTSIAITYIGMPLGAAIASLIILSVPTEAWRTVFQVGGVAPLLIVPLMIGWMPAGRSPPAVRATTLDNRISLIRVLFGRGDWSTTLLLWLGFFLVVLTLHLMINWLPPLMLGRGLTKTQAAFAQVGFNVGGAATALWVGRLLDSGWQRVSIAVCIVALPVVLFLLATSRPRIEILFGLAFLLGGGICGQQAIAFGVASAFYPAGTRGTGVGSAVAAGRLGSLVGPLLAASLLAAGRTPAEILIGVLPIGVVCGSCVGLLGWRGLSGGRAPVSGDDAPP